MGNNNFTRIILIVFATGVFLFFLIPIAKADIASNLIARYTFDESATTTVADFSGNNNNGTIIGSAVSRTNGHSVNTSDIALDFNGQANNYVGFSSNLGITNELTVSAWVLPRTAPSGLGRMIISTYCYCGGGSNQRGWTLGDDYGSDDHMTFRIFSSSGVSLWNPVANFFANNQNKWTHVVGVFKPGQSVRLYINGALAREDTANIPADIGYNPATYLRIGGRADTVSQGMWDGKIDEIRVYNRAFNNEEILDLYNLSVASAPAVTTNSATNTFSSSLAALATLNADVNSNGLYTEAWFEYGTAPNSYNLQTSVQIASTVSRNSPVSVKTDVSNLQPSTTYYYRIVAKNVLGTSYGNEMNFATPLIDTSPPTAPSNLQAVSVSPTQINLSWLASIDNVGVKGYVISRNGSQIANTVITSYSDTQAIPFVVYNYTVFAYDGAGNNSASSVISASLENRITVNFNKEIGPIEKKIFGNNLMGYDYLTMYPERPTWAIDNYGLMDYGSGIWDPKLKQSVPEVINLAKEASMTIVRFPGGCGSHRYDWKKAIGKDRVHFLYGLDEFLKTAEEIGAEVVYTVSYFIGTERDGADLVEYLNSPNNGVNPNGGIDWAAERAKNGHPLPYGVKYFEFDNETWHGNHEDIKQVLPQDYASRYLKYYAAMKAVDPSIKIGPVLIGDRIISEQYNNWNETIINLVGGNLDFAIIHSYPSPVWGAALELMNPKDIFQISLSLPAFSIEPYYQKVINLLKENAGRDIPLAITEYNGGFVQEKPAPYRHTLGNALLNAELLRLFANPQNKVLMANYWQFNNSYWGMVANGFGSKGSWDVDLYKPYYKKPNHYVYELYKQRFGDVLLESSVSTQTYSIKNLQWSAKYRLLTDSLYFNNYTISNPLDLLAGANWQTSSINGVLANEANNILSLEFTSSHTQANYWHTSKSITIKPNTFYKISGFIKTENFIDAFGTGIQIEGVANGKWVFETTGIKGTKDWTYFQQGFESPADASNLVVRIRRVDTNPSSLFTGKVYFKDIALREIEFNFSSPYLSVNASKSSQGDKVYLMVVNKNLDESVTAMIDLNNFGPIQEANAWVLNGPDVSALNTATNPNNVNVKHNALEITNSPFQFTFEPHSLTAIELIQNIPTSTAASMPPVSSGGGGSSSSGSGGGGGGGETIAPTVSSQTSTITSTPSLPISISTPASVSAPAGPVASTVEISAIFSKTLGFGMQNNDVKRLQTFLSQDKEVYPEGKITGYFGFLTKKAIERFQQKHGIVSSGNENTTGYGLVGSKTRAKLNEVFGASGKRASTLTPTPALKPAGSPKTLSLSVKFAVGMTGENVRTLQTMLVKDTGIYPGGKITGIYDSATVKAVQKFQKKYGIVNMGTPDTTGFGLAGPKTRKKLNEVFGKTP